MRYESLEQSDILYISVLGVLGAFLFFGLPEVIFEVLSNTDLETFEEYLTIIALVAVTISSLGLLIIAKRYLETVEESEE